jgi:hypothetical protein
VYPLILAGVWSPEKVLKEPQPTPIPMEEEEMKTIQRLYLEIFGRIPTADEANYWNGQIAAKGQTEVVKALETSPEAKSAKDDTIWLANVMKTISANTAVSAKLIEYLTIGVMTRSDVVSTLLTLPLVTPLTPAPAPSDDGLTEVEVVRLMIDVFNNALTK